MQDCASSNKIKENKYKILRMSLLLGRGENQEETLTNFEEAARDIDTMNDEIYLNDLEGKFYDTLTLEEEEKKLSVLVDYIGGRVEQRISLLSDFSNVTGYDLTNLPPIKVSVCWYGCGSARLSGDPPSAPRSIRHRSSGQISQSRRWQAATRQKRRKVF